MLCPSPFSQSALQPGNMKLLQLQNLISLDDRNVVELYLKLTKK